MTKLPKQLIVLGDSSVYGWGDEVGGGWCETLRKDWSRKLSNPVIYKLGIRGDGLEKISLRWEKEWSARGETRRNFPEAILLSVGLNDTARIGSKEGRHQLDIEAFEYAFNSLIHNMRSKTKVFIMGLTPVLESKMPFAGCLWYSNEYCQKYERRMEEVCINQDVPFLSIYNVISNDKRILHWFTEDGIHMNSKGHLWIYQRLKSWDPLNQWKDS